MAPPPSGGGPLPPEAELDALVNAFPDVGFILDEDGRYLEVLSSAGTEQLLYDDPEELLDETIPAVFDDGTASSIMDGIEAAIENESVQTIQYRLDVPDGTRTFEARIAPVVDESDRDTVVFVARDVTERERNRRELARQGAYMREMLDALDDVFYVLDTDGRLLDWNRTVETVTGYEGEALAGSAVYGLFGADAESRLQDFAATVLEDGSERRETVVETKDGARLHYEFAASVFHDPDGEPLVVGIGRDVTERHERQEQVRIFGLVLRHNMRNKMTVIDNTAEYLRRTIDANHTPAFDRIQSSARDLSALSEKAYDATKLLLDRYDPIPVAMDDTAAVVVAEFRESYPDATITFDAEEARALAIPDIEQAIAELVENAIEHADDEPAVDVSVRQESDVVLVEIADDGPGLPDHEANIITEHREISEVYHASGMGLWLVRWIVIHSGGEVTLQDRDGGGTTFTITLRAAPGNLE